MIDHTISQQTKESIAIDIAKYLERKVSVTIIRSNETGEKLWAISVDECPDFWLNAFKDYKDAEKYCVKHQLPIFGEYPFR